MVDLVPVDHDPFAPPSDLAKQVAGFPDRAANLAMAALGPLGEAGMTLGDALRTGQLDTRDIPQIAGGVMLGTMAPELEEAAPLEAGAEAAAKGIRAYHGSPYDFDKFDISKIGTGEGAQAYGHGLYFAENPSVAETYKYTGLPKYYVETDFGFAPNEKTLYHVRGPGDIKYGTFDDRGDAINFAGKKNESSSKMYQVSIAADPEHFLDWDKPLSEQSPKVQAALQALAKNKPIAERMDNIEAPTGAAAYGAIGRGKTAGFFSGISKASANENSAAATEALRQAGIPGIKYLDQGSRGSGAGTHNYVVFDDKLIDIIKKYGLAGLIAGGASHFSTQPVDHDPFSE